MAAVVRGLRAALPDAPAFATAAAPQDMRVMSNAISSSDRRSSSSIDHSDHTRPGRSLRWLLVNGDALGGLSGAALRRATSCHHVLVGRGALLAGDVFGGKDHLRAGGDDVCVKKAEQPSPELQTSPAALVEPSFNLPLSPSAALAAGDSAADRATVALCRQYARLATSAENPPLNSAFVLQVGKHLKGTTGVGARTP